MTMRYRLFSFVLLIAAFALIVPLGAQEDKAALSFEAEAPYNTLSGSSEITDCWACSEGLIISNANVDTQWSLQFNRVDVPKEGWYTLAIDYLNGGSGSPISVHTAALEVNYSAPTITIPFPSYGDWNIPTSLVVDVPIYLRAGSNTLRFFNSGGLGAPYFDRITLTPAPERPSQGECGDGDARDPNVQPFSCDSIWNMPIGADAVYVPADIQWEDSTVAEPFEHPTFIVADINWYFVAGASEPVRGSFDPGEPNEEEPNGLWRCNGGSIYNGMLHFPDNAIVRDATLDPYETPNNAGAILQPDGRTLVQFQPLARCEATGDVYGYGAATQDLYGQGILGGHFGSGLSSIGGMLRAGELTGDEPIRHALQIELGGEWNYYYGIDRFGYRWPADRQDWGAAESYGGSNPALVPGSLLALPPDVTPEALGIQTEPGLKLFHALQDYGAYVVDDAVLNVFQFGVEGAVLDDFEKTYGFSFETPDNVDWKNPPAWLTDVWAIFDALHIIDNNSSNSIGGGGAPRQPYAPPLR